MQSNRCAASRLFLLVVLLVVILAPVQGGLTLASGGGRSGADRGYPQTSPNESVLIRAEEMGAGGDVGAASIDGRYVVSFAAGVGDPVAFADELGSALGFRAFYVYLNGPAGFAARMGDAAVAALQADPRIRLVTPDRLVPMADVPTGVARIGTTINATAKLNDIDVGERVDVDVAVIDSGISAHPDLNVVDGVDCTGNGKPYDDQQGHGTHVAGTIAALDNGVGVVGVAPGARLYSVRIGVTGSFAYSAILCGLHWVSDRAATIDVVNMSWGGDDSIGPCGDGFVQTPDGCEEYEDHAVIVAAYNAGVTLVAAAGNNSEDMTTFWPATYSQVIAVSALADSDGKIGGKGPATWAGPDDSLADFSNYGPEIAMAAPGVDILSTLPGGSYGTMSGTSMASPHVAGAAALDIAQNGRGGGPASVRQRLRANADKVAIPGDPDRTVEPTLYVGPLAPSCVVPSANVRAGASVTVTCTGFRMQERMTVRWQRASGSMLATRTMSGTGGNTANITIPLTPGGAWKLVARGSTSGRTSNVPVTIVPSAALSPTTGGAGTTISVTLRGYAAGETVRIRWLVGGTTWIVVRSGIITAANGTASTSFVVPNGALPGSHAVRAQGDKGSIARSSIAVPGVPTATSTPSVTATTTATVVATATQTITPSSTATDVPTETPTPTATETAVPSPTPTL